MASSLSRSAVKLLKKKHIPVTSTILRQNSTESDKILKSVYKDIPKLNCTVNEFIWQNLDRWPDKTATVCAVTGHGYTYAQTHKMSVIFAASLRSKLKLKENDTVAIFLPNIPEYPVVLFGTLQAGCIGSIMNPAYTAYEISHQLKTVDCKAIVTSKLTYPSIKEALKNMNAKIPVIMTDHDDLPEGTIKFAELAEDMSIDTDCLKSVRRSPDDVAVIPFSSGTTGFPKGVVLTHRSIIALNQVIHDPDIVAIQETTASHQSVLPAVLPFFHIFGFNVVMMNHLFAGCKLVTVPQFKADLFIKSISEFKANTLFMVPPMATFLGKHPAVTPKHLESVSHIVCGAAPLSRDDAHAVLNKNPNIIFRQGYGLTEINGSLTVGTNRNFNNYSSVGYVLANCEVKIADIETGAALGPGEEGEIWCRGPIVMEGYYKNEAATKEVLTDDGWFKTGDLGKYDENKCMYITDRLKELIKVKGFQVAPAELEALLRTNPKVQDCAVLGIPDPVSGEVPKAFIVKQPNQTVSEDEIKEFINDKVTSYKKVKEVLFVDAIPKNAAGKILRKDLKAKYC